MKNILAYFSELVDSPNVKFYYAKHDIYAIAGFFIKKQNDIIKKL